jgi:hypothetical protein
VQQTAHSAAFWAVHSVFLWAAAQRGREAEVQRVLQTPEEVRRSRGDPTVLLFYRSEQLGRWLCAVAKRLNAEGFLITTYPTDAIKEGERIWSK